MSRAFLAGRREHRRIRTERALALDHGVDFLMEDSWRNPFSDDPLRPRGHRPYSFGRQVFAQMRENSALQQLICATFLDELQDATWARVASQQAETRAVTRRRQEAARRPAAVIEPQSSIPGVQRTIRELERRTYMPIDEIRATFRQGPRSAEQRAVRDRVEDAIRAMVKYHRMVHPVFDDPETYGRQQWLEARETWREFTGQTLQAQRDRQLAFETFGEWEDGDGQVHPVEYDIEADSRPTDLPRRASRTPRKPQILPRIAEAVGVAPRTIRRVLEMSAGTPEIVEGQSLSRQEAS